MNEKNIFEYEGSVHIHSNYSDGLEPIPVIAETAAECGIDFLLFADHMTLDPLKHGMERWFGSVLSIIGYEINDANNKNHYLVFGLKDILPPAYTAQEYVKAAKKKGAVGFIAHPDEKRASFPKIPPYPWIAWDAEGYDGIEIWNHSSEWLEKLNNFNKYYHVLHPLKFLRGPEIETLMRWDEMNRQKSVSGIGGIDAHAFPYKIGPFTVYIFRYKVLFWGIRTHILTEKPLPKDVKEAKEMVLGALKGARCFISNRRWGDARGFRFHAVSGGIHYQMGDTVDADDAEFIVSVPGKERISLIRDGITILEEKTDQLTYKTSSPGAYRVEVRKSNKPWIYSNHIRLKGIS